ncbi:hypothetical protein KAR91_62235 [Candidatus Pacearchaeota archaeon]|nr:hypothetical protein [Candidatus Pacearchaeota archaeon]
MSEFEKWYEKFWAAYVPDLLYNTKGPKEGPFKDKLKRTSPEVRDKILAKLRDQVRYRRKSKAMGNDKPMWCLPAVKVWVNQKRWTEDVPSHMELNKTVEVQKITCIHCPTEVPHKHTMCEACMKKEQEQHDKKGLDVLEKMGIYKQGDSQEELNAKCREEFPGLLSSFLQKTIRSEPK